MERYELRCGRFGTYFYDTKEEMDLDNKDVLSLLNSREEILNSLHKEYIDCKMTGKIKNK